MEKLLGLAALIIGIILIVKWLKKSGNEKSQQNDLTNNEPEGKPDSREELKDEHLNIYTGSREKPKDEYLKIYKTEVPNTKISLIEKVDVSQFLKFVSEQSKREYLKDKKHVYMWDFGVKATKYLNKNDTIWILTGSKLFETELQFTIDDPEGKIGDEIGWTRQFKSPWKNVAILKNCEKHHSYPEWIYSYTKGEKNSLISNFYKIS